MRGLMGVWGTAAALSLTISVAAPLLAQTISAEDVHRMERERLGLGTLRPGASGNPQDANAANADEAKAGGEDAPPLFITRAVPTPENWQARRSQIAALIEDNWVGHIPDAVSDFRIVWSKSATLSRRNSVAEQWAGLVITPDGRSGPVISATITFPTTHGKASRHSPALIDYTYIWPGGTPPAFPGPKAPDSVKLALDRGFAHVAFHPQLLQADTAATMQQGVIGLARWPREKTDWGALRAWAWGASKLREELARDPRINGERISLTGHSRFGKGVLVAAAFDHAFADAHVSSSGAGGAKLMRRDYGERWENMAGSGAYHWFTPNIMTYAAGETTVADLPVDAHMLIALRAPRPLFISSGTSDQGDAWVDPTGMWQAAMLARPAWALYGMSAPEGTMPAPGSEAQATTQLGWYQHPYGHIPWPAYEAFYRHEAGVAATP